MKVIGIMLLVGMLAGCTAPGARMGMTQAGPGAEVDLLAVRDAANSEDGLWGTYKSWWGEHPWITGGIHVGVASAAYIVGGKQGWWGGSDSGGTSEMTSISVGDSGRDATVIHVRGDGNVFNLSGDSTVISGE